MTGQQAKNCFKDVYESTEAEIDFLKNLGARFVIFQLELIVRILFCTPLSPNYWN